jgi:hypothetical protein
METLANDLIKDYRQTQWKEFLKRQGNNPLSSARLSGKCESSESVQTQTKN